MLPTAICKLWLQTLHSSSLYHYLIQLRRRSTFSLKVCKFRNETTFFRGSLAGLTLVELLIVAAVTLLLASVVIRNAASIQQSIRLTNAFNSMVLMLQKARNLALTNSEFPYGVLLSRTTGDCTNCMRLFVDRNKNGDFDRDPALNELMETNKLPENFLTFSLAKKPQSDEQSNDSMGLPIACNLSATIIFSPDKAETRLSCDNSAGDQTALELGVEQTTGEKLRKTFVIHRSAAIPQIQQN